MALGARQIDYVLAKAARSANGAGRVRRPSASGVTKRQSRSPKVSELTYALHTATCSYLLDESGVCRRIASVNGVIPKHIRQCIGAQFVACLDLETPGGLIGELRAGTMALFVKQSGEHMSLLRTSGISRVDDWRNLAATRIVTSAPPLAVAEPIPAVVRLSAPPPGEIAPPTDDVPPIPKPMPVPRMPLSARRPAPPPRTYRAQAPPSLTRVRYDGEEASVTIVLPPSR